ncbi:MAG: hypothetical protein RL417_2389 [Pseudomonadota bacterium]|jgi:RimJ/RimL family protein N-acetyltransferase
MPQIGPQRAVEQLKNPGESFRLRPGHTLDLDTVVITSDRLTLRPVSRDYAERIFAEYTPEVTRYLMTEASGRIEDTYAFIEKAAAGRAKRTDFAAVILPRETGEFLGCCGIHSQARSVEPHLGIWIKKSAHGHGYGREAVSALCDWAWRTLDYPALRYDVDRANTASRKVVESLGGIVVAEEVAPRTNGGTLDSIIYRIPRPIGL